MTFKEVYVVALNNDEFRKYAAKVGQGIESGCLIFAIGDEAFTYGFHDNGVVKVKHNPYRSTQLIKSGKCLMIDEEGDIDV